MSGLEHLLEEDRIFLERKGWDVDITPVGDPPAREMLVVINNFSLSGKYTPASIELLVRLSPGYPASPIDSWWTYPRISLNTNPPHQPEGATGENTFLDKSWQYWSRHPNWRSGIDNLETFMAIAIKELQM